MLQGRAQHRGSGARKAHTEDEEQGCRRGSASRGWWRAREEHKVLRGAYGAGAVG